MSKKITDFTIPELELLLDISEEFTDILEFRALLSDVKKQKEISQQDDLNIKFDLKMMQKLDILTPYEIDLLIDNRIFNIRDLLNTNLNDLNITNDIRRKLDWVRNFYDADSFQMNLRGEEDGKRK